MGESERATWKGEPPVPEQPEGVPEEEGIERADVQERVGLDPEEQPNRPDQPDMSPGERRQYDDPPVQKSLAEEDVPEDR
jgi:hypothetical protein